MARDDAVGALFYRHSTELVGLAFCLLGDRETAEEVVQDAFVALHRHWGDLREQAAAVAYLRAAVVNGCRSRQRRLVRARCRFYLEMTETQTASLLQIGRTSVKTHERRALARLTRRVGVTP